MPNSFTIKLNKFMNETISPFLKLNATKFSDVVILFENGEELYYNAGGGNYLSLTLTELADYWAASGIFVKNPDYVKPWSQLVVDDARYFCNTRTVDHKYLNDSNMLLIHGEFNKTGAIKLAESIIKALEK